MRERLRYLVLLPLFAVMVVSFVFVRVKSGEGQSLIKRQRQAQALTLDAVSRVVRVAPDPVTNKPGRSATCIPHGNGALRNPWSCTIRYRSGRVISYVVSIAGDGSYTGIDEVVRYQGKRFHDTGQISGCCITIP